MPSSHIPLLNLPRFEYNKNSNDLDIIAHVEVDLDADEIIEVQDTVKDSIISYRKEVYIKGEPGHSAVAWSQDLHINILHEMIFDPAVHPDVDDQKILVRERIKDIVDIMGVTGFDVCITATIYNSTASKSVKGNISGAEAISIV